MTAEYYSQEQWLANAEKVHEALKDVPTDTIRMVLERRAGKSLTLVPYESKDKYVEQVREASDIVRVIGKFTALMEHEKDGLVYWSGECPLCGDGHFNVRRDPSIFHCFGCEQGGDIFKFMMLKENLCFEAAIGRLGPNTFGVDSPDMRFTR
jgi:CHC2-type zinc finger protein